MKEKFHLTYQSGPRKSCNLTSFRMRLIELYIVFNISPPNWRPVTCSYQVWFSFVLDDVPLETLGIWLSCRRHFSSVRIVPLKFVLFKKKSSSYMRISFWLWVNYSLLSDQILWTISIWVEINDSLVWNDSLGVTLYQRSFTARSIYYLGHIVTIYLIRV